MKLNDLYPSNYLKAADIGDEPMALTVDRVELADMQDGTRKPCVYFQEQDRGLILNKTNANTIAAAYGDDTDDWSGQRVQLISVPVDFQGKTVEAIRVRVRQPKPVSLKQTDNGDFGRAHRPQKANYGEAKERVTSGQRPTPQELDDEIPF